MKWDAFIKAIEEAEIENGTQVQILISLFKSAGCIIIKEEGISDSTVKKWIDGSRKCKVSSYFPDNQLGNLQGAYNFFRRRPEGKLKKLQQILSKNKDEDSPIDCETKDMERFCWSLVNQFLDILEFQRVDMSDSGISTSDISLNLEIFSDSDEKEISKNAVMEQSSINSKSGNVFQKETKFITAGAQIAIPQYCRICFCCKNLNGDAKVIYKNIEDAYGECKVFGKRVLATDGGDCDKFKVNYSKVRSYEFYRENKILLSKIPDIN